MNPQIEKLIADAKLAIETLEISKSDVFLTASAEWLESIGRQLREELKKREAA